MTFIWQLKRFMNSSASSQLLQDNRLHNSSTPQPEKMNPDSFGAWLSTDVMRWTYAIIKLGCLIARSVRNNYVGVTLSRDTGTWGVWREYAMRGKLTFKRLHDSGQDLELLTSFCCNIAGIIKPLNHSNMLNWGRCAAKIKMRILCKS